MQGTLLSQKGVPPILSLSLQHEDLFVKFHDELPGPIHRRHKCGTLALPPLETFDLGASPSVLGLNFFAEAALATLIFGHIDEFHAACLTGAVLVIAPVGEAGPAPVSTGESLLIVKAHAYLVC